MTSGNKGAWCCWGLCLLVAVLLAVLLPVSHAVCFWVTLLAMACCFALEAGVLVHAGRHPEAGCRIPGWPMSRVVIGVTVMGLLVGFILLALSDKCPWLVAVIVEGLVMTVDAAALSSPDEESTDDAVSPGDSTKGDAT